VITIEQLDNWWVIHRNMRVREREREREQRSSSREMCKELLTCPLYSDGILKLLFGPNVAFVRVISLAPSVKRKYSSYTRSPGVTKMMYDAIKRRRRRNFLELRT
jgi:hypothetical protein